MLVMNMVNLLSSSFSSFVLVLSCSWDTLVLSSLVSILVVTDTDVVLAPLVACLRNEKNYTFAILVYSVSQVSNFLIEYKYRFIFYLRGVSFFPGRGAD